MRWNSSLLKKTNDFRTIRAKCCRRVLFQRSIWAVCPVPYRPIGDYRHHYAFIGLPKITAGIGGPVSFRDARPELAATVRAPVTCEPRHNLLGASPECDPHPADAGLHWINEHRSSSPRTSSSWAGSKVVFRDRKLCFF